MKYLVYEPVRREFMMKRSGMFMATLALLCALAQAGPTDKTKIDAFLAHVAKHHSQVAAQIRAQAQGADDPITEGLFLLDKEFARGMKYLFQERGEKAQKALESIRTTDPYLAAGVIHFLGRTYLKRGMTEEAAACFYKVAYDQARYTLLAHEAWFYLGIAYAELFQRKAAIKTLEEFLKKFPAAPERFKRNARRLIEQLKKRGENELVDLSDQMRIVRRLLDKSQTGQLTQEKQKAIVEYLARLVKELEEQQQGKCKSCGQKGGNHGKDCPNSGPPQGLGPMKNPANDAGLPELGHRDPKLSRMPKNPRFGRSWGQLRPKERKEIEALIEKNFPERYRKLLEQYYKGMK